MLKIETTDLSSPASNGHSVVLSHLHCDLAYIPPASWPSILYLIQADCCIQSKLLSHIHIPAPSFAERILYNLLDVHIVLLDIMSVPSD